MLAISIAGSALAVGSVHTVTLCVVTTMLAITAVVAWWNAEPLRMRAGATMLVATGCALTLYTACQCIPMPIHWLAAIAPHNADVWSRALAPLREPGPTWAPISLDPGATRIEVLKGVAYLLALITALRLVRNREGVRFLSAVIVVTGILLAAAALLHPAFGMHKLFGVYEPVGGIAERHIAPLMNPNNLAGYLNMALCLAFAATLSPEPPVPRAISGAVVVLLGATQVWIASRGGVVTMVLGALIVLAIVRIVRSGRRAAIVTLSLVTGVAAAAGVVLIVLGGSDEASDELLDSDVSKLKYFAQVMHMLPAAPIFGCGRGAFASAFQAFRTTPGYLTFAYPENVIAQWILEWGLPVGAAGLAAVAFALRPSAVIARSITASGAWAGIVAASVQNLGDLGSEIPGLVLAGTVCAAIVVGGAPGHKPRLRIEQWSHRPRVVGACAGIAALVSVVLASRGRGVELTDDQGTMYRAFSERRLSVAEAHALARATMLRHPAEPYLPFAVALRVTYVRDDNPMPWLGATMERANVYGPAHAILARLLAGRSPAQARLEYRLAMEQMPEEWWLVEKELGAVVHGYDDAMEVVPDGKLGTIILNSLIASLSNRLPATTVRLDAELAARAPMDSGVAARQATRAVEDVEGDGAPWCDGSLRVECVREALAKAQYAEQLAPKDCAPYTLEARVRLAQGDNAGGLSDVERALDVVTDRVTCLESLAGMAYTAGDKTRAELALEQIANAGCGDIADCTRNSLWVAQQEEAHGFSGKALGLYRRVFERAPEDDTALESIARLAAQTGLHAEAAEDYAQLGRRHPTDERWKTAEEAERREAARAALKL